jgi:hypothetical protein
MEQRTAIMFCVKLKATATDKSETLKSVYGEGYLPRTNMFQWHKRFKKELRKRECKNLG